MKRNRRTFTYSSTGRSSAGVSGNCQNVRRVLRAALSQAIYDLPPRLEWQLLIGNRPARARWQRYCYAWRRRRARVRRRHGDRRRRLKPLALPDGLLVFPVWLLSPSGRFFSRSWRWRERPRLTRLAKRNQGLYPVDSLVEGSSRRFYL